MPSPPGHSASKLKGAPRQEKPDFGTYHHSTLAESSNIREVAKSMFTDAFGSLPFGRDDGLEILDVGCGLGFLSFVSAEFYPKARVTGIDTFEHSSLKGSSLERAKGNAKTLGLCDRIDFAKGDIFRFTPTERFDIFISNLVFHNLGRNRFRAYSLLSSWTQAGAFVLLGDWFFRPEIDLNRLRKEFKILRIIRPKVGSKKYILLVMAKNSP